MSSSNSYPRKPGAPKPKPAVATTPASVESEEIAIYDALVELPEPAAEEVVVIDTEVSEKAEAAVVDEPSAPHSPYAVVSGASADPVHLSKIVFKNLYNKKSLSVHHLQRRLKEWGFIDAYLDKDGYYGDLTKNAVAGFQSLRGLPVTGVVDADTLKAVFENDTNVVVVID